MNSRVCIAVLVVLMLGAVAPDASAQLPPAAQAVIAQSSLPPEPEIQECSFDSHGNVEVSADKAMLVARLSKSSRTKVVLSIDSGTSEHRELQWDPAAPEGLQQAILIEKGKWEMTPSVDEHVLQSGMTMLVTSASLMPVSFFGKKAALMFESKRWTTFASQFISKTEPVPDNSDPMNLIVTCGAAQKPMDQLTLDPRRAAAASTARGLLDQGVPEPVKEVFSILAEIALERAKSGSMDLLRDKFVKPMCEELTLRKINVASIHRGIDNDMLAFPRACGLLENLRIDDVLSSGRNLLDAARDDLRITIVPALIDTLENVSPQNRQLAKLALAFANRVIDGESSQVAEVDLLVTLLDRLVYDTLKPAGLTDDYMKKLVQASKLTNADISTAIKSVAEELLPVDLDASDSWRSWHRYRECMPAKISRLFWPKVARVTDRGKCINRLMEEMRDNWQNVGATIFGRDAFYAELFDELIGNIEPRDLMRIASLQSGIFKGRASGCAGRVVIAVAKWCSGRDRCSAGDIANMFERPWEFFGRPSSGSLDNICVIEGEPRWFFAVSDSSKYVELAATLVSFLGPVSPGQERARTVSMVRWMFAFVRQLSSKHSKLDEYEEVVGRLVEGDYVRALTQVVAMLKVKCASSKLHRDRDDCADRLTKVGQLLGSVASYITVYNDSKGADPAAAREARKQALIRMIETATDRSARGGHFLISLGSNVGIGGFQTHTRDRVEDSSFSIRVPVGAAFQWLPLGDAAEGGLCRKHIGLHLGLTLADLGQFLAVDDRGAVDDVRWSNFVSPGAEVGVLVGTPSNTFTFTLSGAYAPALFERGSGDNKTQGAYRIGFSVGYYVPFFDFN